MVTGRRLERRCGWGREGEGIKGAGGGSAVQAMGLETAHVHRHHRDNSHTVQHEWPHAPDTPARRSIDYWCVRSHTLIRTHPRAHTTHIHTHAHTRTRTHTHTHIHTQSPLHVCVPRTQQVAVPREEEERAQGHAGHRGPRNRGAGAGWALAASTRRCPSPRPCPCPCPTGGTGTGTGTGGTGGASGCPGPGPRGLGRARAWGGRLGRAGGGGDGAKGAPPRRRRGAGGGHCGGPRAQLLHTARHHLQDLALGLDACTHPNHGHSGGGGLRWGELLGGGCTHWEQPACGPRRAIQRSNALRRPYGMDTTQRRRRCCDAALGCAGGPLQHPQ